MAFVVVLITALMRYNSHSIQFFTLLKCTGQWFRYIHRSAKPSPHSVSEHFVYSCKNLILISGYPRPQLSYVFPCPHPLVTTNLWICLFWTLHINAVIQYVVICKWLLSLCTRFSSFIQVVAYFSISFVTYTFFPLYGYTTFYLSIHQLVGN